MSERILIVEDDPIFRSIIQDNLVSEGYRVDAVSDGKTALSMVRSALPDLIVLDLTLPDCDGLELCPLLGHDGKSPSSSCPRELRSLTGFKAYGLAQMTTSPSPLTWKNCWNALKWCSGEPTLRSID